MPVAQHHSYPFDRAEYSVTLCLSDEVAYAYRRPHVALSCRRKEGVRLTTAAGNEVEPLLGQSNDRVGGEFHVRRPSFRRDWGRASGTEWSATPIVFGALFPFPFLPFYFNAYT